jgi:glycosyltransferase involved in cell wall biosynthesis
VTTDSARIYVLLGTYNGKRFLREQVESIRTQTYGEWILLVRDDGSRDGTAELVKELPALDARIEIVEDRQRNLGCVANFSLLATTAYERGAQYVMFADQDDIWHPNKIERTLAVMRLLEERKGPRLPALVHSDLELIDQNGRPIVSSFMHFQRIKHEPSNGIRTLLVQNFVTGCTVMVNRALLEIGLPFPTNAMMHDWWLAQCAAVCGELAFLPSSTIGYRRHGANAVEVRGFALRRAMKLGVRSQTIPRSLVTYLRILRWRDRFQTG